MIALPLLSGLLLTLSVHQTQTATGVVFEDLDRDGERGADEPGIPSVRVSDGTRVVLTDDQGRYRLEVGDEAIIFLTKPAGYATPFTPEMLPRFYYVHQPAGSPAGLRYPGIEPTGPLPEAIDFPLRKVEEPNKFEALLFADTQPQTEVELDYIRDDVVAELLNTKARFGMTLGDILFDDLSLFPRYIAIVGAIGIPWYNVAGNHDLNLLAEDDRYSLETFKHYFGPPYYAFEVGEAVFFVLDNIEYSGTGASDPEDWAGDGGYVANLGPRQLRWLEQELSYVPKEKLVFLAMHSPLATYVSADSKGVNTQDRRDLFQLLTGRENLYAVAGHTHTSEHLYFGEEDGFAGPGEFHHHVLTTVSGSWWSGPLDGRGIPDALQRDGTPNGWHVLEVDGAQAKVHFRAAGASAEHQMRIRFLTVPYVPSVNTTGSFHPGETTDGRISADDVSATSIVINLFNGGPRSKVQVQIGDRAYVPAERVEREDPHVLDLFAFQPDTFKSWVKPIPSSHLFAAALPDDLVPGVYPVTVQALDDAGATHHGHAVLEVTVD